MNFTTFAFTLLSLFRFQIAFKGNSYGIRVALIRFILYFTFSILEFALPSCEHSIFLFFLHPIHRLIIK